MCTALSIKTTDFYFGRNLDIDCSYGEEVCVMPRNFPLQFRRMGNLNNHYAIIGTATVAENIPLFYDAANEHGLCMAGLNFPENAYYPPVSEECENIAPFELITWILSQCRSVEDTKELLCRMNISDIPFSESIPLSPLHWIVCDENNCIVVESMRDGLHILDNPTGVLTNNPPLKNQLEALEKYKSLRTDNSIVSRESTENYSSYCQGLGAVGLPGDVSSMSRFARAYFAKQNSVCTPDEPSSVSQFFHLLGTVSFTRGLCKTDGGKWDITTYTCCINASRGLYYYTTYDNCCINCVDMHKASLDGEALFRYPLRTKLDVSYQN